MKILIVNTHDLVGGAARAAYRLHEGLMKIGIDSEMLVQNKVSTDNHVFAPSGSINKIKKRLKSSLEKALITKHTNKTEIVFSTALIPSAEITKMINDSDADIVHLHWIHEGMISIKDLGKINKPIVWSLHDNWAFTGGCHIMMGCEKYKQACGNCPILESNTENDLSRKVWNRKYKTFSKISDITVVGLSQWITRCAQASSLLHRYRIINLPNPIDINRYQPFDKKTSKKFLNLSSETKVILFGAMNSTSDINKGFSELSDTIEKLQYDDVELIIFGSKKPNNPPKFKYKTHYFGVLHDDISLRILYSAADVMVVPSLQENLSNTIMESLACSTPVVAFNVGGNSDMIDHQKNGYLAKGYDTDDLASGIQWVIENESYEELCVNARKKVLHNFDSEIVAVKYEKLYREVIDMKKSNRIGESV